MITSQEGVITSVVPLTETAKEVTVTFPKAFECLPGSFVNFFMDIEGTLVRRAYSVVATNKETKTLTLSIRLTPDGTMTPEFWKSNIVGRTIKIMGPMGFNTADKLSHKTIHLFGYGIGAGVIKAIADYSLQNSKVKQISITTGSRSENDIVYGEYFRNLAKEYQYVSTRFVISNPADPTYPYKGYVQDFIEGLNFDDSDIYMCGRENACKSLVEKIKETEPKDASFFVESFH